MDNFQTLRRKSDRPSDPGKVLEAYYPQLNKWAVNLARGQVTIAQEIVQDLYLHFTLTKPDLSQVSNLDGYLYTCLRNIYISSVMKSVREAEQLLSVADFDSMQFALNTHSHEMLLQRQNDLRRVCAYAVWRKDSAKSASYLILLFFHGYSRRQTAEIARVPLSSIYNKLLTARAEVRKYLEQCQTIRIASRDLPPVPEPKRNLVSTHDLFAELRGSVFDSRNTACLSEDALLSHYSPTHPEPISCALLAHIVSCGHCLAVLESDFQWPEEERPDEQDEPTETGPRQTMSYRNMMRRVGAQERRVYDHRPQCLSIAVNGRIVASHDIRGEHSSLSSRVDHPDAARFIEVYTEQDIRLALVSIDQPPEGESLQVQRISLSDDRWLELSVRIDGLGLESEATYFDPTLALALPDCEAEEGLGPADLSSSPAGERQRARWIAAVEGWIRTFSIPRPVWATLLLVVVGLSVWLGYRYSSHTLTADELLARSVQADAEVGRGNIQHEVTVLQEISVDGQPLPSATVESWTDPARGRTIHRLYDGQHHLIAARWRDNNGKDGSYLARDLVTPEDRALAASGVWAQEISASGFRELHAENARVRVLSGGYEITATEFASDSAHLQSATLLLDSHYRLQREILRVRSGGGVTETRFTPLRREALPNSTVPDSVFEPEGLSSQPVVDGHLSGPFGSQIHVVPEARLLEIQIDVLDRLSQIGADTGEPIEVTRTPDGRVRVAGTLADNGRREQIQRALEPLPGHALIDVQLSLQREIHMALPAARSIKPDTGNVYTFAQGAAPADALLRRAFAAQGLSGERLDHAIAQFSHEALGHAQASLQHAYALDRLAGSFTGSDLRSLSPGARHMWADMAARHASILESEMRMLVDQLAQTEPSKNAASDSQAVSPIRNASDFAHAANVLLAQTQRLNSAMGEAFVAGTDHKSSKDPGVLVSSVAHSIPLRAARELAAFAFHLESVDAGAQTSQSNKQPGSPKE